MPHRGTVGAVKACTRLRGVSVVGGVSRGSQTGAFAQTQSKGGDMAQKHGNSLWYGQGGFAGF